MTDVLLLLTLTLCSDGPARIATSSSAAPVGVVRVARGDVKTTSRAGAPALLRSGDRVSVGSGWAELLIGDHLRVRLSAKTELRDLDAGQLTLEEGRAWLELGGAAPSSILVRVGGTETRLEPGSSSVFERAENDIVSVSKGQVVLPGGASVGPGYAAVVAQGGRPLVGGSEVKALVRREARSGLGDLAGWRALVLARALEATAAKERPLGVENQVYTGTLRTASGSQGALLEEAQRPSPFAQEEIPLPGPLPANLRGRR